MKRVLIKYDISNDLIECPDRIVDNFDDIIECFRAVHDNRYTYIRNHLPQYPYDRAQMYMDLHRPSLHIMRQLKAKGELDENQLLFMSPTKPVDMRNAGLESSLLGEISITSDMKMTPPLWQNAKK